MKSFHIATLHKRNDARILLKECASLSEAGYDVAFVVGDGQGNEDSGKVRIIDVGSAEGRFASRLVPMWRAMRRVRAEMPDVVHFHDGMFLPLAIFLALTGRMVVYDVHEDYRRQVLNTRFPWPFRHAASFGYAVLEWIGSRVFTRIVAATPHIASRFPEHKTVLVQNFPMLDELSAPRCVSYTKLPEQFAYIGGITVYRGAREMVDAIAGLHRDNVALQLAGRFDPQKLAEEVKARPGWQKVNYLGWVNRDGVAEILSTARAGLVILHPRENYLLSYPVKLFEYMAAGLPVIVSDFPLWRQIVEEAGCGLLVDPLDVDAVTDAMRWILDHPEQAEQMGKRGRQAVTVTYNWEREAEKLVEFYRSLPKAKWDSTEKCA